MSISFTKVILALLNELSSAGSHNVPSITSWLYRELSSRFLKQHVCVSCAFSVVLGAFSLLEAFLEQYVMVSRDRLLDSVIDT